MNPIDIPVSPTAAEPGAGRRYLSAARMLSVAGLIILFLLLRWNSFTMPFERDEGEYSYSAWLMRQGVMPYEHAFMQKPPMIIYTYMLAQAVSEDSLVPPRVLSALATALSTILVGFIVSRGHGRAAGLSAMYLMTPMMALRRLDPMAANTEVFMNVFLLSCLALYAWKEERATRLHWFAAGVSAAIAVLYKPIALPLLAFIFCAWSAETYRHTRNARSVARSLLAAVSGFLLAGAIALGPFLIRDLGRSLWECAVLYNAYFAFANEPAQNMFQYLLDLLSWNFYLVAALLLWFFVKRPARWWLYGGALIAAVLSLLRAAQGHYYVMAVPFIAIVCAVSLAGVFAQFPRFFTRRHAAKTASATAIIVLALCWPLCHQVAMSPEQLCDWFYSPGNPFVEARTVADHVAGLSSASDRVFVAGSEPEILYYAKRRSSSRFITMYPLMIATPLAAAYQEEAVRELQNDPPEVIVFAETRMSWFRQSGSPPKLTDFLDRFIITRYRLAGGIRLKGKEWRDTLARDELVNCSVLVFQRR